MADVTSNTDRCEGVLGVASCHQYNTVHLHSLVKVHGARVLYTCYRNMLAICRSHTGKPTKLGSLRYMGANVFHISSQVSSIITRKVAMTSAINHIISGSPLYGRKASPHPGASFLKNVLCYATSRMKNFHIYSFPLKPNQMRSYLYSSIIAYHERVRIIFTI